MMRFLTGYTPRTVFLPFDPRLRTNCFVKWLGAIGAPAAYPYKIKGVVRIDKRFKLPVPVDH